MRTGIACIVAAALFAAALGVVAQSTQGSGVLSGRVVDPRGQLVSGASVVLSAAGESVRLHTRRDGLYSFPLKAGVDYELRASYEGLASLPRALRISNDGEKVGLDLVLGARIQFQDVTAQAGIDFVQRNGATGRYYQPEIILAGVAALDYDGDGCMDIFFVNGAALPSMSKSGAEYSNRLYHNDCQGKFSDVTRMAGVAGEGYGMGAAAADFDNDGKVDLFVTGLRGSTLYRNSGDGRFEDVTSRAGVNTSRGWAVSAGWFDYDNDGWLDLFVTHYVVWSAASEVTCSAQGILFYCHPRVYKGLPNQLFHNNRDGTFKDVSIESGVAASVGKGMGVAFGDFNGDGLSDVFVANDSVPNYLFQNLGGGRFKEVGVAAGVARTADGNAVAGMGADFRDADDDGLDDIVLSAMFMDTFPFFRNRGGRKLFEDATTASGIGKATSAFTGWGLGMYDFDNDGVKDLFAATSHFPGSQSYVGGPPETPNRILRGSGNATFEDVTRYAGGDMQRKALYHGAAFADFDNDGRIDVVVTALNSPARLLRNVSPGPAHWMALRLPGLGARVRITLPDGSARYNHATTSVGYASSSEPLVRFGLGPYEIVKEIEITWPGGRSQEMANVKADQVLVVRKD